MGNARARKIPAQLVEDEEYQLRHERVAGIDVAKASAVVCTRLPAVREGGRRVSRIEEVTATVPEAAALAGRLLADGVQSVVMESTSDYWRVWYYVLEAHGLGVMLANSSQARQLAGRPKTDRLDAQWLARLAEMGLLRPSFVPPAEIRELREHTRRRLHLVHDRTRAWQRLEKLLEGALCKLTSVTSVKTKSARLIIAAIIAGERDPRALAALAEGSLRGKSGDLAAALTGMMFTGSLAHMAKTLLGLIAYLDEDIEILEARIAACLEAIPAARGADRDGVTGPGAGPGRGRAAGRGAARGDPRRQRRPGPRDHRRVGLDMTRFRTAAHLVSWAGPGPRRAPVRAPVPEAEEGPGRQLPARLLHPGRQRRRPTDTFLGDGSAASPDDAAAPGPAAPSAAPSSSSSGTCSADPEARFADLGPDHHARKTDQDKKILGHLRQLRALGVNVTVTEAPPNQHPP